MNADQNERLPPIAIEPNLVADAVSFVVTLVKVRRLPGVVQRLRLLADDLELIERNDALDPTLLCRAPFLDRWSFLASADGVRLMGVVVGHPHCGPGPIRTTPIWAIDLRQRWARTLSRFYRLGESMEAPGPGRSSLN